MARVTYTGPGDAIAFDAFEIKRGETVELTEGEIARLRHAGAELEIDRDTTEPADPPRPAPLPEPPEPRATPAAPANDEETASVTGAEEEN